MKQAAKGDTMYLYGKNSIRERLISNPRSIRQIYIQENFPDKDILKLIITNNVAFTHKDEKWLKRQKRADRLQGIIAVVEPFSYANLDEVISQKRNIIWLDGVNDPQNVGLIIRILACFGKFALGLPGKGSCEINDTVLHVASGGENYVPVCLVENPFEALGKLKKSGYQIAGTTVQGGKSLAQAGLKMPLCLILGSEGEGISQESASLADFSVTIPMEGAALSFNVAMACSILCYEIFRQS